MRQLLSGGGWINCHIAYCIYVGPKATELEKRKTSLTKRL